MPRYLISFDDGAMDHIPAADWPAVGDAAHAVTRAAKAAGVWIFGCGLQRQRATVVDVYGGVSSGPILESKAVIGGFAIIEVASREAAHAWAARIAEACRCPQEVREMIYDPESQSMVAQGSVDVTQLVAVREALRQASDASKATQLARFFKTIPGEYGEGDRFLGLTVPQVRGELDLTFLACEQLLDHPHDLIHKACGWMLREAGKRNLDALRSFLNRYVKRMPRTMLRYAIEWMPLAERRGWLAR